ncbi:PilZ domain-containing protein [Microvirga sp. P5_D2]
MDGSVMDERRSAKRWRTILAGRIIFVGQSQPMECVVRDLSDTGARLYFADPSLLPSEFELEIPSRDLKVRSRLMWSQGANHGVMFMEEVKAWTDPLRAAA